MTCLFLTHRSRLECPHVKEERDTLTGIAEEAP
jgi:hypothetical protein